MRPQDAKNIPRPVVAAVAKYAASATTFDMPINASKLEVTTRQAQGGAAEDPERIAKTAEERRANFNRAVEVVDDMIAKGFLKKPVQDYILTGVTYKDEVGRNDFGKILLGQRFYDRNDPINRGRIVIYKDGAVSLRVAIETYAHEIGHFNPNWDDENKGHRLGDIYGREAYDTYLQRYHKK